MQSQRILAVGREVLALLSRVGPGEREPWLAPLLRLAAEATGGVVACLGEAGGSGVVRHVWVQDRLERRDEDKLRGLGRAVLSAEAAVMESTLGRPGPFRATVDGWQGVDARGYAAAPVRVDDARQAWIAVLRDPSSPEFDGSTLDHLEWFAIAFGTALSAEARCKELESLAMTDGLTQIPNYRFLRIAFDHEIARSERNEQVFSVVMVDVDNLKQYNHVHGHLLGSELLRNLAQILRRETRASDIVTRYGGDEFLIILPRTERDGALILAERLRRRVAETLRGRNGEVVTCSFGVSTFPRDGDRFESLLSVADLGLSTAKGEGRNLVVCQGV